MGEPRTVVITGASRGLGFASAVRLYHAGWRVVAAMRTPDLGIPLLRQATGASEDDDRLIGVQLDLLDAASISVGGQGDRGSRRRALRGCAQCRDLRRRNGGGDRYGVVAEDVSHFSVLGPVALTQALLPSMRAAGEGRIVLVSSAAGVRGQPATAPYSAAKGALERWGESMAVEIAPFGLGVTTLVAGTYDTDIITDAGTIDDRNFGGPYARLHNTMNSRGRFAMKFARPPERFTDGLLKALDDKGPLPTSWCRPGCLDAVGRQQDSAGVGHAPHVPRRARHTETGFDAGRGVAADHCAEGDGFGRTHHSRADYAALGVACCQARQGN